MIHVVITKTFMKHIIREQYVPFKVHQIFDLVNDTEGYADFVPFCVQGKVIKDHGLERVASLSFGYHGLCQTIKTHNVAKPYERIDVTLLEGPFDQLNGSWEFEPVVGEYGARVRVEFKYELSTGWLAMAFEPIFEQVLGQMISCFCDEAEKRYGKV